MSNDVLLKPVDELPPPTAQAIAETAQAYAESIVDTVREPLIILRADLRVQSASRSFYRVFGVTPEDTENSLIFELGNGQWNIPALRALLETILTQNTRFDDYEVTHDFPDLGKRTMLLNARSVFLAGNHTKFLLLAIEDVTDRLAIEAERQALVDKLNAELTRQTRIARILQRPLLMETPDDAFPGLSVATIYSASRTEEAEVGGDFFDAYALADGRVALLVGDSTGKGIAAAARSQECKDVLRAFMRLYPYHAGVALARLNDYFCEAQSLDDRFTDTMLALSLALVDYQTGEVTMAWGGSEPPLLMREGGQVEVLAGGGALVGVQPQALYEDVTATLLPGDTLLLWSDGLSDARHGKVFLGLRGVVELMAETRGQGVRQAGENILAGARAFARGNLQDDACFVLVRRRAD